jgi:myo-inositol-1(or 4)-monophosphatase
MDVTEKLYDEIILLFIRFGQEVKDHVGAIADIGPEVGKTDTVTHYDRAIEKALTELIHRYLPAHTVYGEELTPDVGLSDDTWVVDPISGTDLLLGGQLHYAFVATHVQAGQPVFTVVYDPTTGEMFTARRGQGAFLNGQRLSVAATSSILRPRILVNIGKPYRLTQEAEHIIRAVEAAGYQAVQIKGSFALRYARVAQGLYDGFASWSKDAFPEYAGQLLVSEAGGKFSAWSGLNMQPDDLHFIGGTPACHKGLLGAMASV